MTKMTTVKYVTIRHDGVLGKGSIEFDDEKDAKRYEAVRAAALAVIGEGSEPERVNVWFEGRYVDMFVDELGLLKHLPRNEPATTIYRANWMTHEPNPGPAEDLPFIVGDVILFMEKVWR